MRPSSWCLGSLAALLVLAMPSCSLDDRPLSFEYHALEASGGVGGHSGSGGDPGAPLSDAGALTDGGDNTGGRADAGAAPESGAGNNPSGGVAGSLANGGADGGVSASGSANGGATTGGSGGAAGTPAGGTGASGGSAGAPFNGPCGDLNHNLIDDCSETLVQNSRFDSTVNPWVAETSLTATWDATNASGKPGSGSLSLSHTGPGGTMIGAHQCIAVTPNASYDVAARVQLAAGQTGTAGVNVYFYDDDACQANLITGNTPIEGGVAGSWIELATTVPLWIPGNTHSMYVRLVANKPNFQTTPLKVLIDDVLIAKRVMP